MDNQTIELVILLIASKDQIKIKDSIDKTKITEITTRTKIEMTGLKTIEIITTINITIRTVA